VTWSGAIHLLLHIAVPGAVAYWGFRDRWKLAWLVMAATMVIDVDHLVADPIYDPGRCSIGFHPLHRYPVIGVYMLLALVPRTRLVGLGLLIHIGLDAVDCLVM
jgi:hypothetical protein